METEPFQMQQIGQNGIYSSILTSGTPEHLGGHSHTRHETNKLLAIVFITVFITTSNKITNGTSYDKPFLEAPE